MDRGEHTDGPLPLSTAQVGMWMRHQLDPSGRAAALAESIDIRGAIDPDRWAAAWRRVLAECDACRVVIVENEDGLTQIVTPATEDDPPLVDVSGRPDPRGAAEEWIRAELSRPVDLSRTALACALLKVADDRFLWYHRYHHIAIDYYGAVLLTRRLADVYSALVAGRPMPPSTFGRLRDVLADETRYRRSPDHTHDRRHWLGALEARPAPPDLYGRGDPAAGGAVRRTAFLPESLARGIRAVATRAGTSWSRVLVAAAAAYQWRLTGDRDILLGLPVAGRTTETERRTPSMLANVVPLRLTVPPSSTWDELVARAAEAVSEALPHQRYRYEDLRRDLGLGAEHGLFGWTVNVMSFEDDLWFAGHPSTRHNVANGPVEDLSIFAFARADGRGVQVEVTGNPARYRADDVDAHLRGLLRLLEAIVADPAGRVDRAELLGPDERHRVLVEWNGPAGPTPQWTFPELFEARAAATPDATALIHDGVTVRYAELNARANRWAHHLIRTGVGPGDVVALACGRTVDGIVGLLAIVKAGAAFLPVDVDYPRERVAFMLADARPATTLVTRATADRLPTSDVVFVGDSDDVENSDDIAGPERDPTDHDRVRPLTTLCPAYVIYTSGSTGPPNGVVVGHAGLAALAAAQAEGFAITARSRILQFASPGFDGAVAETLTALASGAALVLAAAERLAPGEPLAALVAEAGVTHVTLPPTVLAAVPDGGLPGVTTVVVAGEPCPADVVARWAVGRRMVNAYGPTEATVCATMSDPLSPDGDPPPIGRPIARAHVYVVDSVGRAVGIGVVGQLCLAGAGLAHGYLGRPGLTADRFRPDPFGPPGSRLYRTGDLVRWRPDGTLEFVGRVDRQVALRGFRIEPGEVETVLVGHPSVAQSAVAVVDGQRLVAFVVPALGHAVDAVTLRRYAAERLPGHLVPSGLVALDRLPLTPNGKLDRLALPRASATEAHGHGRDAASPLEAMLCELYAEVLGRPGVRPEDDFFALGGHSLLALRLVHRLRRILPVDLSVQALLQAPTVADLAERLTAPADLDPRDDLLRIRATGTHPPLFCVPPGSGLSWCYTGLRAHLPTDLPIYGLQARIDGSGSVDQLASGLVARIREAQPSGPYHLLGWSFGGHLAHAVAAALRAAGDRVALLAVLDAYPHDPRPETDRGRVETLARSGSVAVARLLEAHRWPEYDGDLLLFVAARDAEGAGGADAWRPYVVGTIESHDVPCGHFELTEPMALATIGAVLAERLTGRTMAC